MIFPSGRFPALQKGRLPTSGAQHRTQTGEWRSWGTDRKRGVQGPWSPSKLSSGLSTSSFHGLLFPFKVPHSLLFRDWNCWGGNKIFFSQDYHLSPGYSCGLCALSCSSPVWLCDPVDHQAPLSEGFPGKNLEGVAISFSRGSSRPRDGTLISCVSCIGRWVLYD